MGDERRQYTDHTLGRCGQRDIKGQSFPSELVHHRYYAQRRAASERVFDKVIRPNVARIGCFQARRARHTRATATPHTPYLHLMCAPQPSHALLVDHHRPPKEDADAAVAIAWVAGRQFADLAQQRLVVLRLGRVQEGRARDLHQRAGTRHGEATVHQETHRITLLGHAHPFFCSSSLRKSFSSIRSASRRLSRAFSFSSSLSRWASCTDMPP